MSVPIIKWHEMTFPPINLWNVPIVENKEKISMNDITLNGVSINDLKKQKKAIQKDASKFIADNTEQVKELVAKIMQTEDSGEIKKLSKAACEILDNINVVSDVSGVEYYFDYSDEYGSCSDDDILSSQLNNKIEELDIDEKHVSILISQLEDMEYNVQKWNTSTC